MTIASGFRESSGRASRSSASPSGRRRDGVGKRWRLDAPHPILDVEDIPTDIPTSGLTIHLHGRSFDRRASLSWPLVILVAETIYILLQVNW